MFDSTIDLYLCQIGNYIFFVVVLNEWDVLF